MISGTQPANTSYVLRSPMTLPRKRIPPGYITDGPDALEFDWNSSLSDGANNGYLTFCVDGEQQGNITGIDNDTRRVNSAQMGAFSGIDSGTRGNMFSTP